MASSKRLLPIALLLMLVTILVGCGGAPKATATSPETESNSENTVVVEIKNFKFDSDSITIPPGTRVVFINRDPTPHNVVEGTVNQVSDPNHKPAFESPALNPNESWEIVFEDEGTYSYVCTIAGHWLMGMVGEVNVVAGAEIDSASATVAPTTPPATTPAANSSSPENQHNMIPTPDGLFELQPFRVEGNVKEFAIDVQEVTHELDDGVVVTAWAFNGTVPGPTLRVEEGDLVRVHFTNTHHQPHTIHWHGIYADQKYDGVPHTSTEVMPGQTYVYEFVAEQAGTFFYHCHVDSYRHLDLGMAGALIIDPKEEKTWDHEYTIILDDWDSEVDPLSARYRPNHNYFTVNGKPFPHAPTLTLKVGETTRIRLVNAGYYNFAMHAHGPSFTVVATDGRPLDVPYSKDTLDIAPGERYDIEFTPTKAGLYPFHAHNLQYVLNNGFYPGGMHLMFHILDVDEDFVYQSHAH